MERRECRPEAALRARIRPLLSARLTLRVSRSVAVSLLLVTLWSGAALVGLLRENPFLRATEEARKLGGWTTDQVHFVEGRYGYRLLFSRAEARLAVATSTGERWASVELVYLPIAGWSVRHFTVIPVGSRPAIAL